MRVNFCLKSQIISELHSEIFPNDPLDETNVLWWTLGGPPVGFLGLIPLAEEPFLYLYRIGVKPQEQGKGYGKRLLKHAQRWAKTNGYLGIITDTTYTNPESVNNLIKRGFLQYNTASPWKVDGAIYWKWEAY